MANRFLIGATYYPEHWLEQNHAKDLDRMAKAGFNVVRLGEGAWWYWEPEEGKYQFELFDRVIKLCKERDIKVIMGTPTYTGPAWIMQRYPEVLRVNFERVTMAHGSRQNYCHTSPKFRELSRNITAALAKHYAKEKQIIAWQLDNEINNGVDASYAASDSIAFRAWLRKKYKSLDNLNDAWGTRFWSQLYDDWEQVDLPSPTAQWPNPTRLLDHSRFVSDSAIAFLVEQGEILRKANPKWQITHNGIFGNISPPALRDAIDFYSHDHYPLFWKTWPEFAGKLIESRSVSFPFAIMEQQSGPGGQMGYLLRTPEPGEIRLWTYQSVAHGADKLLYFTWRTCPFGSEQHWHGLIDQDGKDNRRLREATKTAREIATLPTALFDARPIRQVAVLRDYDCEINEKRINTYTNDGRWAYGRWTSALTRRHIATDVIWERDAFEGYSIIVAPHQKIVDDKLVSRLTKYVRGGGTLILGAQAGLHDRNLHIHQLTPPGPLAALAGCEVEDWTTLAKDLTRTFTMEDGTDVNAFAFVERLKLTTGKAVAHWKSDRLLGEAPAMVINKVGRGRVIYIGAYLDPAATDAVVKLLASRLEIESAVDASEAVECILRENGKTRFVFLLNHNADPQTVSLKQGGGKALLGPAVKDGNVTLEPYGVSLLRLG